MKTRKVEKGKIGNNEEWKGKGGIRKRGGEKIELLKRD